MSKRMFVGVMVAALAVVLAGGALASNMGFKLNASLITTGGTTPENVQDGLSQDGTNDVALPDFLQTGMITAKDLLTDIGTTASSVSKLLRDNNTLCTYTGAKGTPCTSNFTLTQGESYRIRVLGGPAPFSYVIVGAHNPAFSHVLVATGQAVPENVQDGLSQDGTNTYDYPYNSTAATAKDLLTEIGTTAASVSKLLRDNNTLCTYTGAKGTPCTSNFSLVPGEGYRVRIVGSTNVSFIPNHY